MNYKITFSQVTGGVKHDTFSEFDVAIYAYYLLLNDPKYNKISFTIERDPLYRLKFQTKLLKEEAAINDVTNMDKTMKESYDEFVIESIAHKLSNS